MEVKDAYAIVVKEKDDCLPDLNKIKSLCTAMKSVHTIWLKLWGRKQEIYQEIQQALIEKLNVSKQRAEELKKETDSKKRSMKAIEANVKQLQRRELNMLKGKCITNNSLRALKKSQDEQEYLCRTAKETGKSLHRLISTKTKKVCSPICFVL